MPPSILLADGPLLAVNKPAGLPTQAPPGLPNLEADVRAWIKATCDKPGGVYLGVPHRLDRPVSGVVVFARNSKVAARLAEQFREHAVQKVYWAVTEQPPEPAGGYLQDWLAKVPDEPRAVAVPAGTPGARKALLRFRTLGQVRGGTLLEVVPESGRMHQIRVQLSRRGWPLVGDRQYGAAAREPGETAAPNWIALHALSLRLLHPVRYNLVRISAPLPDHWQQFEIPPTVLSTPQLERDLPVTD
jgi:23S rRNA pseudouridine1911/1915/1917 synthase